MRPTRYVWGAVGAFDAHCDTRWRANSIVNDTQLTFQIDVAVNAPEAGVLREFFANEEDTVTVGQDLVRIEVGAEGEAPAEKPAASEAPKEEEAKPAAAESKPEAPKPAEPSKPAPAPEKKSTPAPPKQSSSEPATPSPLGSREERRVSRRAAEH